MSKEVEEAIETLTKDKNKPLVCGDITIVNIEDLETVLNYIKELERENENFRNADLSCVYLRGIYDERAKKEKEAREKIKELEKEKEQIRTEKCVVWDSGIYKIDLKIQILKEILEGEKE